MKMKLVAALVAAVSIPANISEGFKRRGLANKLRMLNIAQGSLEECRYYLLLARDLDYGNNQKLIAQIEEVSRLLSGYMKGIEQRKNTGS